MRLLFVSIALILAIGGWYVWEKYPQVRNIVETKVPSTIAAKELFSFKIRYGADQLMQANKESLIRDAKSQYLEPSLTYYPYLLMEIKFSKDATQTQEGVLLWGLNDGEMVLDTFNWNKTHGYQDCIAAKATRDDLRILKALVENGGVLDREKIYQKFKVETETVDSWLDSCRQKKLIVVSGNKFRLHFQNPHLEITPLTRLDEWLVTLPKIKQAKVARRYNPDAIQKFAYELFGSDFVIRRLSEVYLPVYILTVQNADGSLLVTRWNALSGQRLNEDKIGNL